MFKKQAHIFTQHLFVLSGPARSYLKTEEASCFNARELLEYSRTPIQAIKRSHSISPRVAVRVRLVRRTIVKFQITVCKNPKFLTYKVTYLPV